MQLSARATALFATLFVASATASTVQADGTTGTWTGALTLQGNYYWETSTRVMAPSIGARLVSPDGTEFRAEYLVDAITSASIAAGVSADIRFTEVRNQVSLGAGREFDLGEAQLRLDLSSRVSHEPDYLATGVTLGGQLALAQRCTLIGASLTYIHDDVGSVIRGEQASTTVDGRDLSDRGRVGQLEGVTLGLSLSQVLTPQLVASAGYDLVHNWGYLQNPYRSVMVQGLLRPEDHPDQRTRNSFYGRVALYVPETRSAVHALYRMYVDEWGLAAITPEARFYQEIGDLVTLRLRYRYYDQTRSFFSRPVDQYVNDDAFLTADPKMSRFHSHLFGLHARLQLGFLQATPLEFLHGGEFWLSFDYLMQTSRFGDAVIAQGALRVPF